MGHLDMFFKPQSIAVVGASSDPSRGGYMILQNIVNSWGKERVYPVNPKGGEILGLPVYKSLLDVPEQEIDLVVMFIPSRFVLDTLEQCKEKHVKGVIIESAGFAEVGEEGKRIQDAMVEFSKKTGIRIWGGNCMAFIMKDLITTFLPIKEVPEGKYSIVGQSGYFSGAIYEYLVTDREIGVRKACSIGNKTDIDENDMLLDFMDDPDTEVMAFYLESFKDGRRFYELAKEASKKKPIICLPGAMSPVGKKAALSHTGAVASGLSFDVLNGVLGKQAGVILAQSFKELFDFSEGFLRLPLPKGRNLAIITITGAGGVLGCDLASKYGLNVPELPPHIEEKLKTVFPDWMPPKNPVDSWPAFEKNGVAKTLRVELDALLSDPNIDMVLLMIASISVVIDFEPGVLGEYIRKYGKPVAAWINGEKPVTDKWTKIIRESGSMTFDSIETAIKVLARMVEYYEWKTSHT